MNRTIYQLLVVVVAVALTAKWWLLFGWISRRFERQADIYGVRTLAASNLPCDLECALHTPHTTGNPGHKHSGGDPLCRTAAHIFGETLNQVAVLNGIPPEAGSWRHGSISSRSRTVIRLAGDPRATARFERTVYWTKVAILIVAFAAGLLAAWDLKLLALIGVGDD